MSEVMYRKLEGVHEDFPRHIMVQRAVRQEDQIWRNVAAEKFL